MGREIRKVPADWEHPRDERGDHIPLFDGEGMSPSMLVGVPADKRTHYMLYETTSEGTPHHDSPVFESVDELCRWAETHATTFGSNTASADEWKRMLTGSGVYHEETLPNGVKAIFI